MGGPLNPPRQETANSSHQAAANQPPASTYSDPLLPTQSADNINLNHYQPDMSPLGVTQLPNCTSSPSSQASAQRDSSSGEPMRDGDDVKQAPIQPEPVRTAEVTLSAEDPECIRDKGSPPPPEPRGGQPCASRLSLFSGMELVTKGRPLCDGERETWQTETDTIDADFKEEPAVQHSNNPVYSSPPGTSKTSENAPPDTSQPVSAFSFLKFWPTFYSRSCSTWNQWCHHYISIEEKIFNFSKQTRKVVLYRWEIHIMFGLSVCVVPLPKLRDESLDWTTTVVLKTEAEFLNSISQVWLCWITGFKWWLLYLRISFR